MNSRLLAGVLAVASGVLLWWVASTPRRPAGDSAGAAPTPLRAAAREPSSPEPASDPSDNPAQPRQDHAGRKAPDPLAPTVPSEQPVSKRTVPALAAAEEPPGGPELNPGLTPAVVLENTRAVFRQYALRFGANPVGSNAEITQALGGGNARQVNFLQPDDGLRVNTRGELIDNWGTPYFFHQLSGTVMEIHSAGPDRKLWTADDLVIK